MANNERVPHVAKRPISEMAKRVCLVLKNDASRDNPMSGAALADNLGLTRGQLSSVIKYMRRCSLLSFDKFIGWYPVSSKNGYYFAESVEDMIPCFRALYWWSESIAKTILPLKKAIIETGFDIADVIRRDENEEDDFSNYINNYDDIEIPDMAEEAWNK